MARSPAKVKTTGFRLRGVYAAVDGLKQHLAKAAAEEIAKELALLSPQYTGKFANNWVILPGNVPIKATEPGVLPRPSKASPRTKPKFPTAPSLRNLGIVTEYTIGNRMKYRDIAMDLVPGRVRAYEPNRKTTALQDWYVLYLNSPNGLRRTIQFVTGSPVSKEAWVNAKANAIRKDRRR